MTLTWVSAGLLREWTRDFWECVWEKSASSPCHLPLATERMEMVRMIKLLNMKGFYIYNINVTASIYLALQEVTSLVRPHWCLMWFCWTFITPKMKSQLRYKAFQIPVHARAKLETSCVTIITVRCWTGHSLTPGKQNIL